MLNSGEDGPVESWWGRKRKLFYILTYLLVFSYITIS